MCEENEIKFERMDNILGADELVETVADFVKDGDPDGTIILMAKSGEGDSITQLSLAQGSDSIVIGMLMEGLFNRSLILSRVVHGLLGEMIAKNELSESSDIITPSVGEEDGQ